MARNDFMLGFLQGMYNAGLGNPQAQTWQDQNKQNANVAQQQQDLNQQKAQQGMMPAPGPHPEFPQRLGNFLQSVVSGGGSTQTPQSLNQNYVPNPNATVGFMNPQGQAGVGKMANVPQGAAVTPLEQTMPLAAKQFEIPEKTQNAPPKIQQTPAWLQYRSDMLDFMKKRLNAQQIDTLANKTGIQPHVLSTLQTNNVRADRALEILNKPNITWQEFNTVITDWSGIMQGGLPHEAQFAANSFPNWQQKTAEWKTYVTAQPQATVPPEIKNYMTGVIQGLKGVDNEYLKQNSNYMGKTIGTTIPGYNQPGGMNQTVQQGTQNFIQGAQPGNDVSRGTSGNPGVTMPQVGTVSKGYRFKGGDPSQQSSWEQVQ